jgi:uncharacterized protein YhbP (UPF0306 family)
MMKRIIAALAGVLLFLSLPAPAAEPPVDGISGASWLEPPLPPPDEGELKAKIEKWLDNHWMLTLATVGARGVPHASPVVYFNEGLTVYIRADRNTNKIRNIVGNPQVAYTVWEPAEHFEDVRSLQVAGQARLLEGEERRHILRLFREAPGSQQAAQRELFGSEAGALEEQPDPQEEQQAVVAIEPILARWIERARSADEGQVIRFDHDVSQEPSAERGPLAH